MARSRHRRSAARGRRPRPARGSWAGSGACGSAAAPARRAGSAGGQAPGHRIGRHLAHASPDSANRPDTLDRRRLIVAPTSPPRRRPGGRPGRRPGAPRWVVMNASTSREVTSAGSLSHHGEEDPQVRRRGQHRVAQRPGRHELQITVKQGIARHRWWATDAAGTNQARISEGHQGAPLSCTARQSDEHESFKDHRHIYTSRDGCTRRLTCPWPGVMGEGPGPDRPFDTAVDRIPNHVPHPVSGTFRLRVQPGVRSGTLRLGDVRAPRSAPRAVDLSRWRGQPRRSGPAVQPRRARPRLNPYLQDAFTSQPLAWSCRISLLHRRAAQRLAAMLEKADTALEDVYIAACQLHRVRGLGR